MTARDVIITEFMNEAAVASLAADFAVLYDPTLVDGRDRLVAAVAEARAIVVRNRTVVDAALLDAAPHLVVVGRLGVGLDNIDVPACTRRGVAVHPATGANAAAVAEYVITAILALTRRVLWSTEQVIDGSWPRTALKGGEVAGRTLGLVGLGTIAREVAVRAAALGMEVAAYDPFVPPEDDIWQRVSRQSLDTLITDNDAISIHVPLTEETRHLIGPHNVTSMRPGVVLVNTARGGIVDDDAVVEALRSGHLGGAALDVFADEPLSRDQGARYANTPNLILTPHIAGITTESDVRVGEVTAAAVRRALQGGDDQR
ncbi:MAG: hydroxyacid dehydrogenase [Actinomycetota bacterium]